MSRFIDRFRAAVSRRRKTLSFSSGNKDLIWKRLPDNVFVILVALCELDDIPSLALTCRLLHRRIFNHEVPISRRYLNLRRRKGECGSVWEKDLSPGDDLTFISELFPPPPPQYTAGEGRGDAEYSLAYLMDLKRCWTTCIRLSYHLADHAVRHRLETDPNARELWSSSKTEQEVVYSKSVGEFQSKLLPAIAYATFFLENSAAADCDSTSSGQVASVDLSIKIQQSILQKAPFTDTQILISTHHCMQLLCSTIRRHMSPDFPYSSSESWVSLLLLNSTFERVVEFFVSVARDEEVRDASSHGSNWSHRKEFLWQMREDLGQYLATTSQMSNGQSSSGPTLDHVWFRAAYQEMFDRGVIPHSAEDPIPVIHWSAVTL
ncbi:hypothetical protein N7492_007654 [Penicillium capsulatum]|uniref:Uncharacterized protein n=1 Tax=Penicillium capsulatum TaxID=69766 RepID=A0A9W9I095_9EURO|nr:hypothetical protein N7492_007654 [Penicillium capsulatum]KAJ6117488.1 hypothetical protein N7512_007213 [Penicillium capsulatum]